jgi:hypothetical protein
MMSSSSSSSLSLSESSVPLPDFFILLLIIVAGSTGSNLSLARHDASCPPAYLFTEVSEDYATLCGLKSGRDRGSVTTTHRHTTATNQSTNDNHCYPGLCLCAIHRRRCCHPHVIPLVHVLVIIILLPSPTSLPRQSRLPRSCSSPLFSPLSPSLSTCQIFSFSLSLHLRRNDRRSR